MLLRLIVLLIFMSPVVLATLWFSDNAGSVQVEWLGWHVDSNVPVLLAVILVVFLVFSALSRLSALVADLPSKLGKSRQARGLENGMSALLAALDAAETGDVGEGRRFAAEAARLLNSPGLAARLDRLLPRPPAPPVAPTRSEAAKGRLFARKPSPPPPPTPVVDKIQPSVKAPPPVVVEKPAAAPIAPAEPSREDLEAFSAKIRAGEWQAAQAWIGEAVLAGRLTPLVAARWRSVALEGQALGASPDDPARPLRLAREAMAADQTFLAPALHVIRAEVSEGRKAEAETLLASVWRHVPARVLLVACAPLWRDEDMAARLKWLEALAEIAPQHPEGRRHIMAALTIAPDALGCRLMAEIEEREPGGSARSAEIWRRREHEAPPSPAWICGACRTVSEAWAACCPSCSGVATVEWTRPVKAEGPSLPAEAAPPPVDTAPVPDMANAGSTP